MTIANDRFLLDQRLETRHKAQAPAVTQDYFFNVFVTELITQDYQLPGPEYLQYGVVDGAQDCGVDAVFTFVNGTLVTDDFKRFHVGQHPQLDLHIVQCKTASSFTEGPIEKLVTHLPLILDLERSEGEVAKVSNPALLSETRRFLDTYVSLTAKRPSLRIFVTYAAKADEPSAGVLAKAELVKKTLQRNFREAEIDVTFLGSRQLVDMARRPSRVSRELRVADSPLASDSGDGYVCLVRLSDYFELIRDPHTGRLDAALFEANVREHEGETDVNSDIHSTLTNPSRDFDFWWLNNGVTIVAEGIHAAGKRLTLESPQIVNGLQTSTEIFKHLSNNGQDDDRLLLVRLVQAQDNALRDQIVKATNSQNELPLSALRATEPFQRDIEEFLVARGFYYDRKRNYSRTRGYDDKRVVSMSFLGHSVNCALAQMPHISRAEGANLLNDDERYTLLFNASLPLNLYLKSVWLLRIIQAAIIDDQRVKGTSVEDWQYHVTSVAAMLLSRKESPTAGDIAGIEPSRLAPERVRDVLEIVSVEYQKAIPSAGTWSFADLSTSPKVFESIKARAVSLLKSQHWRDWPEVPVDPEYAVRATDNFYLRVTGRRQVG